MTDLVIVGAGPAGMAAALEVAEAGFRVCVVDEQARAGGQIFRRPPAEWGARHGAYRPYGWARDLIERFEDHPRIERLFRATAFGVLRDREGAAPEALDLAVSTPEGGRRLRARRLLIATGAYDTPVAFPGWTLPGVMSVGAVQSLLKSQKLLAGQRIVLAGSHPIQLILAAQLLQAGAELVEVAVARDLPGPAELARSLPAMPGHLRVFAEAARALTRIARSGVPVSRRTLIARAQGSEALQAVELTEVDSAWRPTGPARRLEADVLALGYGFTPSTELARQAGCALDWRDRGGGWTVRHDASFRTSAADVFVAGEPTGIGGAQRARAEGQAAGQAIAASLGASVPAAAARAVARGLVRSGRFSHMVSEMFAPQRAALAALSAPPDTVVCRCEEVRSAEVTVALDRNPFVSDVNALKLECRTGMGPCQVRYCEGTIAARIAAARDLPLDEAGRFNAHLPIKPVPLRDYCGLFDKP